MKESIKESARKKLDDFLALNSMRKTSERYRILDAICDFDGYFTVDELQEILSQDRHFIVSRATLYNTIKLFIKLRLIVRHRFQGKTQYEMCQDSANHFHQMCTICGKVKDFESPELTEAVSKIHLRRFRIEAVTLYVYGACSTCLANMTRRKTIKENKKNKNK